MADINRLVYVVLIVGMLLSTGLLTVGLATACLGQGEPGRPGSLVDELGRLVDGLAEARPSSMLFLGVLILVLTPVARVAVCALVFLVNREFKFASLSLLVLGIIGASALVGVLAGVRPGS